MHALVTGATGFLGSAVARALLDRGDSVRALARPVANRKNLAGLDVEIVEGDLRDRASLRRALAGCDALFHVAADYRLWARDPRDLYATNVEGTRALLEEALAAGTPKIVYTSSVAVLRAPGREDAPADERAEPIFAEIVGHYKRSKYLAEKAVLDLCRSRALPCTIVLPSTPIGPRDIKPTPTGKIVVDFLSGRIPGYVDTGLNLIDVDDCARGHILALERGAPGERYILGNENLTLREIFHTLADLTGLPAPRFRVPYAVAWTAGACSTLWARLRGGGREPGIPLDGVRMSRKVMFFDPSRAIRELGLPRTPARESLRRAALWFCREGYVPGPVATRIQPSLERAAPAIATA